MKTNTTFLVLLAVFFSSCSLIRYKPVVPYEERGYASWYGPGFHGKRTASGEVFDMYELTAASRTLPVGSYAMVTNLENGKSVVVRINDFGPFVEGRIIDLSYAAAKQLEMIGKGVVPVVVQPISVPASFESESLKKERYTLQVGSFISYEYAVRLKKELEVKFKGAYMEEKVIGGRTFYRVRVGFFSDYGKARSTATKLASKGYQVIIIDRSKDF